MQSMQASPWPDVIISSQPDMSPVFPSADSRPASDFHVELPHSSIQHVTNDPFSRTTSGANATAGNAKLAMPGTADMYGDQKSKAGKAAAQE